MCLSFTRLVRFRQSFGLYNNTIARLKQLFYAKVFQLPSFES